MYSVLYCTVYKEGSGGRLVHPHKFFPASGNHEPKRDNSLVTWDSNINSEEAAALLIPPTLAPSFNTCGRSALLLLLRRFAL